MVEQFIEDPVTVMVIVGLEIHIYDSLSMF